MPSIFDFDCTISVEHTFGDYCIEKAKGANQYALGTKVGETNIKREIETVLKHNEQDDLSSVATYHNNPDFVAGNIAMILKKELTFVETIVKTIDSPKKTTIAINVYKVEGLDKPFLISYLPHEGDAFQSAMRALGNKNEQIEFIRELWLLKGLIRSTKNIDFYEDSSTNYKGARALDYINGYLVPASNEFTIIGTYKAPALKPLQFSSSSSEPSTSSTSSFVPSSSSSSSSSLSTSSTSSSVPSSSSSSSSEPSTSSTSSFVPSSSSSSSSSLSTSSTSSSVSYSSSTKPEIASSTSNIGMMVLEGFIAAIGIAAVAIAAAAIALACGAASGLALAVGVGTGVVLAGVGLFATRDNKNKQTVTENSLELSANPV